jgi:hypothetical protein
MLRVEQSKRKGVIDKFGELAPAAAGWRVSRIAAASPDLVSSHCGPVRPVDDYKENKNPIMLRVEQSKRKGVIDKFGELAPRRGGDGELAGSRRHRRR